MTDQNLKQVQSLTNDISNLKDFLSLIEKYKTDGIEKLYFVFKSGTQLEFKGRFSEEATGKILDIIIESRKKLILKLEDLFQDLLKEKNFL